jgi:hypothetical protein
MSDLVISLPIWICLVCYAAAVDAWLGGLLIWLKNGARLFWSLACVAYLLHVAAAFHLYHHWSHQHAFDHTADRGGFGQAIYISYAFTAAWPIDALWTWMAPVNATRVHWLHGIIHFFVAFMLFNGAVVFAHGFSQLLGIAVFGYVALLWTWKRSGGGR